VPNYDVDNTGNRVFDGDRVVQNPMPGLHEIVGTCAAGAHLGEQPVAVSEWKMGTEEQVVQHMVGEKDVYPAQHRFAGVSKKKWPGSH